MRLTTNRNARVISAVSAVHGQAADAKSRGETDQMVTLGKLTRSETSGDRAYVVVPAVYSFKRGGTAMRESAQMTFTLKKDADGWLIHSWTWTGPRATPSAEAR